MKETFNNLKLVYQYGKNYKKSLIIFSVASLLFIVINVIYPIYTAKQLMYLNNGIFNQLLVATLIILAFDLLGAFGTLIIRRNTQMFFRGTFKKIQLAVSREILKIKVKEIDSHSSGVFIERLNHDCSELSHIFTMGMGHLTGILSNIGIFVAVFLINKYLFLYYLVASIIVTNLHLKKVREVNQRDQELRRSQEKNIGLTGELVRGVRDIKMLHASASFMSEIENSINNVSEKMFKMRNTDMNYNFGIGVTTAVIEFILILILMYLVKINNITLATAVVLFSYKSNIMNNLMQKIGDLLTEIKDFNLSSKRVFSLLDDEFEKEKFGEGHIDKIKGNFEFKNVFFSYGEFEVLKDLSFKIKENETVAFVGKSGAGKTTIFSLLCKLYDINSGEILLDGNNINEIDEYSIRNNITIISQNPYIFNMSIRDNLRLVKEDLTDKEMKKACKMACLDDFIKSLPLKYDTIVGEGGVNLSGGQRQRLAIARAFVQDTKIILFDEATSALDNETQKSIQQAIENMKDKYTVLIIAHRLSTIINSDRIMLVDDGKIVAEGKHKKLLKENKLYKSLYENELLEDTNECT